MQGNQRSFMAAGTIGPSLFVSLVKVAGVNQAEVSVSPANDVAYGVSHEGTREAPIPGVVPATALDGEPCLVYGLGDPCEVYAAEIVTAGNYLKPDVNGRAVIATEGEQYSAVAVSTTTAPNQKVKVTVMRGIVPGPAVDSVAATGSAQGDAALLPIGFSTVSAADGTRGVRLPAALPGRIMRVYNEHATNGLRIYPATGGAINGGTANAAIIIEGRTFATLVGLDGTNWAADFIVNV